MKFSCPSCGQKLAINTVHSGKVINCPKCSSQIVIPKKLSLETTANGCGVELKPDTSSPRSWRVDFPQSGNSSSDVTVLSEPTTQQHAEDESPQGETSSVRELLSSLFISEHEKYKLGEEVARGGQGAIICAYDRNLRRNVAMKVILETDKANKEDFLRFIEEAQITSQLEHPGIVPVHELGIGPTRNVFYTMKFVSGETLKDILEKIKREDSVAIQNYSLNRLLTIFQKLCDAVAFAHSRNVVHRDLKPENIMVGEYGEVLVMDWGLAKILTPEHRKKYIIKHKKAKEPAHQQLERKIESIRREQKVDTECTMMGTVMGTPAFMAPEQAEGNIEAIDTRTDIYALGAILYNILTLHSPVPEGDIDEMLKKVVQGEILHPSVYNSHTRTKQQVMDEQSHPHDSKITTHKLPHCPGGRIPESLAAVVMKAMSLKKQLRYQSVKELQEEIEAYQSGFATRAEGASLWKIFKLFIKRHKSAAGVAILLFVLIIMGSILNWRERVRAEKALVAFQKSEAARAIERKRSAPSVVDTAKMLIEQKKFDTALDMIKMACDYDPDLSEARLIHALLLMYKGDYSKASEECRAAVSSRGTPDPDLKLALEACETASRSAQKATSVTVLASVCSRRGMPTLGVEFASSGEARLAMYREKLNAVWPGIGSSLTIDNMGRLSLSFDWKRQVGDISRLKGIPLNRLNLTGTAVSDLSPLEGMPLTSLTLTSNPISDISPLGKLPLKSLFISFASITNLEPLRGMSLESLTITHTPLADISPLAGMPLTNLVLSGTHVTDLTSLSGMKLKSLIFDPHTIKKGLNVIREMQSLEKINYKPPAVFWEEYNAKK